MSGPLRPIASLVGVTQRYARTIALDAVSIDIPAGCMVALIGPDGVGKSTLLGIIAGARKIQSGHVDVLGGDMADAAHRTAACPRIAFMPQGLGRNLYADLSVRENLEFFSRLFGQPRSERHWRVAELLAYTGLAPFADRQAKKLSGGMRQKLGLCCALIHDPDLLILDEPTTGVDPLSRRQFWELIERLRSRRPGMSVIVATAYMEEAERFDFIVAMNDGRILKSGAPADLKADTRSDSIEDAFIALLTEGRGGRRRLEIPPRHFPDDEPAIVARNLTCRFGDFTAVDHVNFTIERGEIFGFVGSNGCGKTTTMKMLTGLLPPSEGEALLFGKPLDAHDMAARLRVGYMSQSFSLYTELTVRQNLELHARLFHIPAAAARARLAVLVEQFGLRDYLDHRAADLPLGIRQRLSLAVAIVHEPDMLILDEPTSGVDPLARDRFWQILIDLSRNRGVTIFVSTHFMNEAERCDRLSLMDSGRVLATDSPANLVRARGVATLEDAFIGYLTEAAGPTAPTAGAAALAVPRAVPRAIPARHRFSPQRLFAYTIRETIEILRDPIRLTFALFGTALLMIVFGYGISTDVNNLTFAVLDRDQSHESRAYLEELRGSSYFVEQPPVAGYAAIEKGLQSGAIDAAIEIPPGFGRNLEAGRPVSVGAWVDGAMPFRAATISGYLQAMHQLYLSDPAVKTTVPQAPPPAQIELRFKYNQNFESIYAMVPTSLSMLLALFPAILMALAIVREKELGSITNLYVTPVTRIEFLLGKQIPYIGVAMANFTLMVLMALFLFRVPLTGSFIALLLGTVVYVTTTTAYGMVISAFASTQIAALFGTAILTVLPASQFAGMMVPVSSLSAPAQAIGRAFPMTYFIPISVGTFTKGLDFAELAPNIAELALFIPVLIGISFLLLRKQER